MKAGARTSMKPSTSAAIIQTGQDNQIISSLSAF
jgi:hypothetical protein